MKDDEWLELFENLIPGLCRNVSPPGNNSELWRIKCPDEPRVAVLYPSPLSHSQGEKVEMQVQRGLKALSPHCDQDRLTKFTGLLPSGHADNVQCSRDSIESHTELVHIQQTREDF